MDYGVRVWFRQLGLDEIGFQIKFPGYISKICICIVDNMKELNGTKAQSFIQHRASSDATN